MTSPKFVVFDIGNVLAVDLYVVFLEDIIRDDILNNTPENNMQQVTKVAADAMNDFKLGNIKEEEFFRRVITNNNCIVEALKTRNLSVETAIQQFKQQLRLTF